MTNRHIDRERGKRITWAINQHGPEKAMALAAELGVSAAAVSKWKHGHALSLENACRLSEFLDVSLDWLAMGRNVPAWLQGDQLSQQEIDFLEKSRCRPTRILKMFLVMIAEIPERDKLV